MSKVYTITDRFSLSENFLSEFKDKQPKWGYGMLSYVTYKDKYARLKEDGTQEEYYETLKRVTEGVFSIQKSHCRTLGLEWNGNKAQNTAQKMYRKMWEFKFLPPGRGLWAMGTDIIEKKGSGALNNCAFISTDEIANEFTRPFTFLMDFSMLGVGVGFDLRGADKIIIKEPRGIETYVIPDTREGWIETLRLTLEAYLGRPKYNFDPSLVRKKGSSIKGFGGIASGPEPLLYMVETICAILDAKIGELLDSVTITDICNIIGKCVVSGNVRRSAEIGIGRYDDMAFIDMKNPEKYPEELKSHRWASNNSVFCDIGMNYTSIAKRIAKNGEPGLVWMDNIKTHGRFRDGINTIDDDAAGLNPCFSGSEKIETEYGYRTFKELEGKTVNIKNRKGQIVPSRVWFSGIKEAVKLSFSVGVDDTIVTPNQKFATVEGLEIQAKDTLGKRLIYYWSPSDSHNALMVKLGFIQGDANLTRLTSEYQHKGFELNFGEDDQDVRKFFGLQDTTDRKVYVDTYVGICRDLRFSSRPLPERQLPKTFDAWEDQDRKSFLKGLYTANGSVIGLYRIALKSTCKEMIGQVQKALKEFGIDSYITTNKSKEVEFANGTYTCKESYDLNIGDFINIVRFAEQIGFVQKYKMHKLEALIASKSPKVISVEALSQPIPVYDFEEPITNWGIVNGLLAHNCGEQVLESNELCCLVETFPANHANAEDYHDTLKYAYLYAKTVTLVPTHDARVNAVMLRNKRIGTSMSGIEQAKAKFGYRHFYTQFCERGYHRIQYLDKLFSRWLCVVPSKRTTSVKPSGTVSLLAGATPGIHYAHAEYYFRTLRFECDSPIVAALRDAGYRVEESVTSKSMVVVYFPIKERDFVKSKDDVSIWEQMENIVQIQAYWSDNSVSCTVTFKKEETDDVLRVLEVYDDRLKNLTLLPLVSHGYKQAPYITITAEEYNEAIKKIKHIDKIVTQKESKGERFCTNDSCTL